MSIYLVGQTVFEIKFVFRKKAWWTRFKTHFRTNVKLNLLGRSYELNHIILEYCNTLRYSLYTTSMYLKSFIDDLFPKTVRTWKLIIC